MLETASREIRAAAEENERRRREGERLVALVSALDDLLTDLEELTVRGVAVAPDAVRQRAAELVAEASKLDEPPDLPASVANLMDRAYDAQEIAMLRRRRAGWGLAPH